MSTETDQPAAGGIPGLRYRQDAMGARTLEFEGGLYSEVRVDVVVYGATPGGIAAAVRARRLGATVALIESSHHIGGMASGGLAAPDTPWAMGYGWSQSLMPGFADEFFRRVTGKFGAGTTQYRYLRDSNLVLNCQYAKLLFSQFLAEAGVSVVLGAELLGAEKDGARLTKIRTTAGTFAGASFVDATYEGDLIAAAGCSFQVGREASATYAETLGGKRSAGALAGVDPYVVPGSAASGLLYGIEPEGAPGALGSADDRVQAATYRFALTSTGPKIAITEPDGYDASRYEVFGRYAAASGAAWTVLNDVFTRYAAVPPNFDINSKGAFSTNWVGPETTEYITATYERRREIESIIKNWVLGFLWFAQTDSRIPAACRADVASYGLPVNEFIDSGHFPPQLYVRQGRRLVSDFVMTEADVVAANAHPDPIAFCFYSLDSHPVRRHILNGVIYSEGALMGAPYIGAKIPWRVILPKKTECENLLATFGVSASHVAFVSMRMEPIHMSIGDAAGATAALAASRKMAVQDLTYAEVFPLTGQGAYLPRNPGDRLLYADNSRAADGAVTTSGVWTAATENRVGLPVLHRTASAAGAYARYTPTVVAPIRLKVYIRFPVVPTTVDAGYSAAVPVAIFHAGGTTVTTISMGPTNAQRGGDWDYLGEFDFVPGGVNYVEIQTDGVAKSSSCAVAFKAVLGKPEAAAELS